MQRVLRPGNGTVGSESNSSIKSSTTGRDGADGTSVSTPHIFITAETGEDATRSAPFTFPSAECATDVEAVPETESLEAEDRIPNSADEELTEAIGEKLRRGDNDEQDKRRR